MNIKDLTALISKLEAEVDSSLTEDESITKRIPCVVGWSIPFSLRGTSNEYEMSSRDAVLTNGAEDFYLSELSFSYSQIGPAGGGNVNLTSFRVSNNVMSATDTFIANSVLDFQFNISFGSSGSLLTSGDNMWVSRSALGFSTRGKVWCLKRPLFVRAGEHLRVTIKPIFSVHGGGSFHHVVSVSGRGFRNGYSAWPTTRESAGVLVAR